MYLVKMLDYRGWEHYINPQNIISLEEVTEHDGFLGIGGDAQNFVKIIVAHVYIPGSYAKEEVSIKVPGSVDEVAAKLGFEIIEYEEDN